jgi:hypothetical protein
MCLTLSEKLPWHKDHGPAEMQIWEQAYLAFPDFLNNNQVFCDKKHKLWAIIGEIKVFCVFTFPVFWMLWEGRNQNLNHNNSLDYK